MVNSIVLLLLVCPFFLLVGSRNKSISSNLSSYLNFIVLKVSFLFHFFSNNKIQSFFAWCRGLHALFLASRQKTEDGKQGENCDARLYNTTYLGIQICLSNQSRNTREKNHEFIITHRSCRHFDRGISAELFRTFPMHTALYRGQPVKTVSSLQTLFLMSGKMLPIRSAVSV